MFISDLRLKREFCCFPSFEMFDNWIEEKGKEVLFRKVLAFVLIRQQEGSYAGSHRAMAKDISSSCLCECQGQKQQILFLSSSQGRDDQTASLKRAILLLRFEGKYVISSQEMLPIRCIAIGRSIAFSYQLCRYWQKAAGREKDKLSFLHRRALGHIRDLKGLLHELNPSSILAIMIILNPYLYFWTGLLMKALYAWSNQGQPTFIFKWKKSSSFDTFILLMIQKVIVRKSK